jgi:hypothetical protein
VDESVLSLDEAVANAATGDVWLFRGRSIADRAIQAVTNSPINHVGMCVALDDMPPLMWHAELGRSLPDVFTGERQRGVQLHILRDAVTTWDRKYGQRAWMRQLGRVRRRDVSKETIYCAELLAATYQHMGILPSRRPPSWYDPGKFWSGDHIDMAEGFSLGEEIAIR